MYTNFHVFWKKENMYFFPTNKIHVCNLFICKLQQKATNEKIMFGQNYREHLLISMSFPMNTLK